MEVTSNSILKYLSDHGVNGKQYELKSIFNDELSLPEKNDLRNLLQELHRCNYLHVSGDVLMLGASQAGAPLRLRDLNIKLMLKQEGYNFIQTQKMENTQTINSIQMEMAELFLKLLADHGTLDVDQQSYYFTTEKNYKWHEFTLMRGDLIDEGLIKWMGNEENRIKPTPEGKEAARMGLQKYRQKKEGQESSKNYNISIQGHGNVVGLGNIQDNIIANTVKFSDDDLKEAFEKLTEAVEDSIEVSKEHKQ